MCFKALKQLKEIGKNSVLFDEDYPPETKTKRVRWNHYKTNVLCSFCDNKVYYREPKDFDPKSDEVEYSFLDQMWCKKCKKSFWYIDAFFYHPTVRYLEEGVSYEEVYMDDQFDPSEEGKEEEMFEALTGYKFTKVDYKNG